jgi:transposase
MQEIVSGYISQILCPDCNNIAYLMRRTPDPDGANKNSELRTFECSHCMKQIVMRTE